LGDTRAHQQRFGGKLGGAQPVKRHFGGKPDAFQAEFEDSKVDGESKAKKGGGK